MKSAAVELKKIVVSSGFWFCVVMSVVLLFAAEVWIDYKTMSKYSVFRLITNFDREYYLNDFNFCRTEIMGQARSGWFTLFVPMITAFCFVPHICAERETNAVRYEIFRSSDLGFSASRFLAGIVSSGAAMTAGYLIFCGIVSLIFPAESEYAGEFLLIFSLPKASLGMFFYGAFWSVPAMFLTAVMRNKYLIMCIPFFIKYALSQTNQKLISDAYGDLENINEGLGEFALATSPEALLFIDRDPSYYRPALLFGGLFLLMTAGYLIIQMKRGDKGA